MGRTPQVKHNEWRDGGVKSRKLWFSAGTSALIFLGAIVAGYWPAFLPSYATLVGGLLATLGLYLGGNVSTKWVVKKHPGLPDTLEPAPPPPNVPPQS
ncbi:hypothetical protein UFOVP75_60 [uncultured Caudovirales phage]|uniref:Uncharacterized protein n=1 Tax=uncultured Caudovirales phage TaxID=2100421 RepID=A0A6J5L1D8_9CAUD|nr:hypothetical protein UFOVP75_60 [uncultured Caudovirales phage]